MNIEQEPKYDVNADGKIINRATGVAIPDDEPVFILRAKDVLAVDALRFYAESIPDEAHKAAVVYRALQFELFARKHPKRMKMPDTTKPAGAGE